MSVSYTKYVVDYKKEVVKELIDASLSPEDAFEIGWEACEEYRELEKENADNN